MHHYTDCGCYPAIFGALSTPITGEYLEIPSITGPCQGIGRGFNSLQQSTGGTCEQQAVSLLISFSVKSATIMKREMIMTNSVLLALIFVAVPAMGESIEITTCRNPSGTAYRHFSGNNDAKASGWSEEKISNSVVSLTKDTAGKFDLLYVDFRKKPISMTQEGAKVIPLRSGPDAVSFLVHYDGSTTEVYSFFQEKDGKSRYTVFTSRIGPLAISAKSSIMVGDCNPIAFDRM